MKLVLFAFSYLVLGCGPEEPMSATSRAAALHLLTQPALPRNPDQPEDIIEYVVRVGQTVRVRAEIQFEDGTRQGVTGHPWLSWQTGGKRDTSITKSGELTFHSTGGWAVGFASFLAIYHDPSTPEETALAAFLLFQVLPEQETDQ